MISNKCQKASTSTLSEDRVPWSYCGFKRNYPSRSSGEGFGNNKAVPPISYKRPSFSERDLSTNWENVLLSNCSSSSSPSQQIPSKITVLQIFQTQEFTKKIHLSQEVRAELQRWVLHNLKLGNDKSLLSLKPR